MVKKLPLKIVEADLTKYDHQLAVLDLLDAYAQDPMGNGKPLPVDVRRNLIAGLQQHPTTLIFLAYRGRKAIGIAVCFRGFSTFSARPLINISDLAVLPEYRGQTVGLNLLKAVEGKAHDLGCCKITLEVQENNYLARTVYKKAGFRQAVYQKAAGGVLSYSKPL